MDTRIEVIKRLNELLYRWGCRQVHFHQHYGNDEQAARWCQATARHAAGVGFSGTFADPVLEKETRTIGARLRGVGARGVQTRSSTPTTLHVLSQAWESGGHTRLCYRWIDFDSEDMNHSVVLTNQKIDIPEALAERMHQNGRSMLVLDPTLPLTQRAIQLWDHASRHADLVVLHSNMEDPIPLMAFAVAGGPPVVMLNHADHLYWLGASVVDFVAEIRPSGQSLSRKGRGIRESHILPIPLPSPKQDSATSNELRKQVRSALGIPSSAIVYLTIGSAYKFAALPGLDFVETAVALLARVPDAHIVAVGPSMEGPWLAGAEASGNRLHAVGVATNLEAFHSAADIYLEGFPIGSLTALLEAGLVGLPCVCAPAVVPLPYRSDDISLKRLPSPASLDEYLDCAERFALDNSARISEGAQLRASILEDHCGEGWRRHLATTIKQVPKQHRIHELHPAPPDWDFVEFWIGFKNMNRRADVGLIMDSFYRESEGRGMPLEARVDPQLAKGLIALSREPGSVVREMRITELFWEDGYRAFQRKDVRQLLRSFCWFLRARPTMRRFRGFLSLFVQLVRAK